MTIKKLNKPALAALALFIVGGLVALYLGHEVIAAALIGTAVGQAGPQPVKLGGEP